MTTKNQNAKASSKNRKSQKFRPDANDEQNTKSWNMVGQKDLSRLVMEIGSEKVDVSTSNVLSFICKFNQKPVKIMEEQPTSPHLQIYRPQLTSILSISHRLAGLFLGTSGLLAFTFWIASLALGPDAYSYSVALFTSPLMQPILFLWTIAFYYHFSNGIRHLFWDLGWGFQLTTAYKTGYLAITNAIILSSLNLGLYNIF